MMMPNTKITTNHPSWKSSLKIHVNPATLASKQQQNNISIYFSQIPHQNSSMKTKKQQVSFNDQCF